MASVKSETIARESMKHYDWPVCGQGVGLSNWLIMQVACLVFTNITRAYERVRAGTEYALIVRLSTAHCRSVKLELIKALQTSMLLHRIAKPPMTSS